MAFAISDAVAAGVIGRGALAPIERGQKGYWRAMARLQQLAQLLSDGADKPTALPNVSILLIDSQLWTRLRSGPSATASRRNAPGPAPRDVALVTNEFVLAALLDGSLSAPRAFDIGVLAVDGDPASARLVQNRLLARLVPTTTTSEQQSARKILVSPWGSRRPGAP